jgi:hypothetical protein
MNGESALLWLTTISTATKTSMIIIGASHQAFLTFRKFQISPKRDLLFAILQSENKFIY